jgi:hypothetical protein
VSLATDTGMSTIDVHRDDEDTFHIATDGGSPDIGSES